MSQFRLPTIEEGLPRLLAQTWKSVALMGGSGWLKSEAAEYYFRVGPRAFATEEPNVVICVTIANIITPESFERTGIFNRTIKLIREITLWPIHLENARKDWGEHLIKHYGWKMVYETPFQMDLLLRGRGGRIG